MGLRDVLTRPLTLGSAELSWQEPFAWSARLRGDVLRRLIVIAGAWLVGFGILLGIFSLSREPADWKIAFGLAFIFAGYAYGCVFGRRRQVAGRVAMHPDTIRRRSASFGFLLLHINDERWEYGYLDQCVIVPAQDLRKSFSALVLSGGGEHEVLPVPARVDLPQLAQLLQQRGVRVIRHNQLPETATRRLSLAAPVLIMGIGMLVATIGIGSYAVRLRTERARLAGVSRLAASEQPDIVSRPGPV